MLLSQLILQSAPRSLLPWPDCRGEMDSWDQGRAVQTEKQVKTGVVFLGVELGNCRMASMVQGKDGPAGLGHKDLGQGSSYVTGCLECSRPLSWRHLEAQ